MRSPLESANWVVACRTETSPATSSTSPTTDQLQDEELAGQRPGRDPAQPTAIDPASGRARSDAGIRDHNDHNVHCERNRDLAHRVCHSRRGP